MIRADTAAVGAELTVEQVEGTDPWVIISGHRTFVRPWGVALGRVTLANRFGISGGQAEVEAYPRLGRVGYLYAAAAASPNDEVFLPFRGALEVFASPGGALELSLGARLFKTTDGSVVAYTGSFGSYRGNYWGSFRPFVVSRNGSTSTTGQLALRRFWAGRYDYVGAYVTASRGVDPGGGDPSRFQRAVRLTSYSARIERLQPRRNGRLRVGYGLALETEEVSAGQRRSHLALTLRAEHLLR